MTVCGMCDKPIEGADYEDRHDDGELEYHEKCCPHPLCQAVSGGFWPDQAMADDEPVD